MDATKLLELAKKNTKTNELMIATNIPYVPLLHEYVDFVHTLKFVKDDILIVNETVIIENINTLEIIKILIQNKSSIKSMNGLTLT